MPYASDPFRLDELRRQRQRRERQQAEAHTVEGDVSALTRLRSRGWKLGDSDDLDAIEDHVAKVRGVYSPIEFGSELHALLYDARQAVTTERRRRELEHERAVEEQRQRIRSIHLAARHIEDAAKELAVADGIEDRRAELLPRVTIGAIDAEHMDGKELDRAIQLDERAVAYRESAAEGWTHDAELLLSARGDAFMRHAETAKAMAAECAEDADAYRSRLQALRAARDSRESPECMDADALRKRVAELEQAVSASGNQ